MTAAQGRLGQFQARLESCHPLHTRIARAEGRTTALRRKAEKSRRSPAEAAHAEAQAAATQYQAAASEGAAAEETLRGLHAEGLQHETAPLPDLAFALAARGDDGSIIALLQAARARLGASPRESSALSATPPAEGPTQPAGGGQGASPPSPPAPGPGARSAPTTPGAPQVPPATQLALRPRPAGSPNEAPATWTRARARMVRPPALGKRGTTRRSALVGAARRAAPGPAAPRDDGIGAAHFAAAAAALAAIGAAWDAAGAAPGLLGAGAGSRGHGGWAGGARRPPSQRSRFRRGYPVGAGSPPTDRGRAADVGHAAGEWGSPSARQCPCPRGRPGRLIPVGGRSRAELAWARAGGSGVAGPGAGNDAAANAVADGTAAAGADPGGYAGGPAGGGARANA